jgi:hypothetical protein
MSAGLIPLLPKCMMAVASVRKAAKGRSKDCSKRSSLESSVASSLGVVSCQFENRNRMANSISSLVVASSANSKFELPIVSVLVAFSAANSKIEIELPIVSVVGVGFLPEWPIYYQKQEQEQVELQVLTACHIA